MLAAAEAFFAHRGLWILRTHTVRRLETLARHLDDQQTRSAGQPLEPAVLDRYATELDDILNEDYTRWQQLRATTPETHSPSETPGNAGQKPELMIGVFPILTVDAAIAAQARARSG